MSDRRRPVWARRLAPVVFSLSAFACGSSVVDSQVGHQAAANSRGVDAGPDPGSVVGGSSTSTLPLLTVGAWPDGLSGTIAIPVELWDFRGLPITVTAEIAAIDGSFHAAHLAAAAGPFPAGPQATTAVLSWDSIADIGFHDPQAVTLRLTPADAQGAGAPVTVTTPLIDNLRAAARRVNHYMITYGGLAAADIATAKTYQLVIIDPSQGNLTRDVIASIQEGMDPNDPSDDVIVLGYVSVGEDLRTRNLSAAQMLADPRFVGDGTGPRIDPRGWQGAGGRLDGINPMGAPSNGGTGFASY